MPIIAVTCPQCGVSVMVEDSVSRFFCTYCGSRLAAHVSSLGAVYAVLAPAEHTESGLTAKKEALAVLKAHYLELTNEVSRKRLTMQQEGIRQRAEILHEAGKQARLFQDPRKTAYYLEKMQALDQAEKATSDELTNRVTELKRRIKDLSDEIYALASRT